MADRRDLASHLDSVQRRCSAIGWEQGGGIADRSLLAAIRALSECISRARADLTALGAADIVRRHVPAATDELDAIITHTAAATGTILDECERLEHLVAGTASQPAVTAVAARIYEACSFQDITGQRVTKVVQTLQLVEARVNAILFVFDPPGAGADPAILPVELLNGPQRPRDAMDQGAVDALLAATA